jgi:hypothetical protein
LTTADIVTAILAVAALSISVITIFYAGLQTKAAREAAVAAEKQAVAAEKQVSAAEKQVSEMQRQTELTLAALEPQLELQAVKAQYVVEESAYSARHTLWREEWRLYNYGDAPAVRVHAVFNFDNDGILYGQQALGTIAAGEYRRLRSSTPIRMPDYKEAKAELDDVDPSMFLTYENNRNEPRSKTLLPVLRDERNR